MGLDPRESTPGFKRQVVVFNAETRSSKRAALLLEEAHGCQVSANTINRICQEVGEDLAATAQDDWRTVLSGEVAAPEVAIIMTDGGRIRTREMDCGPGVHLRGTGWNETKNAILVSASSETSALDPQPDPPACFLSAAHVAELAETAKTKENAGESDDLPQRKKKSKTKTKRRAKRSHPPHKPRRIVRTVLSSLKCSRQFGMEIQREAKRRKFREASRKAFVADGLPANWAIHAEHFRDFTPILDFTHAVTYLFRAAQLCVSDREEAWSTYARWMTWSWRGQVSDVLGELGEHRQRLGPPPEDASDDDPREQLRLIVGYLENNRSRMRYAAYRRDGLPTTSAWMESAVKEINHRVKGTEMFWNHPDGAEAILQIRAARLSDDGRLARFLARRPGSPTLRRSNSPPLQAA